MTSLAGEWTWWPRNPEVTEGIVWRVWSGGWVRVEGVDEGASP